MKTYTKIITNPRLVIQYDNDAKSPRKWDGNIGLFFTNERNSKSPDGNTSALYDIMISTADEATSTADHIERMKAEARKAFMESTPTDGNSHDENLHIIDIYPVYKFEHGNVVYRRGTAQGFDYSNSGFYIVTAESISGSTHTDESIQKAIDAELEIYTQWCNGEVYQFTLYGEDGDIEESCGGFYEIEDIREYLPEEWKDEIMAEYVTN